MDLVVGDAPSCKDAAVALGITFSSVLNNSTYPAGCFTVIPRKNVLLFNQKIDPSSTSPVSVTAGICRSVAGIVVNDNRV